MIFSTDYQSSSARDWADPAPKGSNRPAFPGEFPLILAQDFGRHLRYHFKEFLRFEQCRILVSWLSGTGPQAGQPR